MINIPRVPLFWQNNEMAKAASKRSPSYESARDNVIHTPNYKEMEDRPSTHAMSRIRRYPDGKLDFNWATRLVLDALHKAESGHPMTPVEESMLTVIFPIRFNAVEVAQSEVRTQLSRTEKAHLKELVEAAVKEELNWNAGNGGSSVPGMSRTKTD